MEIKFRYLLDSGWVYYTLEEIESDETIGIEILDRKYKARNQYTGGKDRNNKEIYEGDIVEWMADRLIRDEVIFEDGCFMAFGNPISEFILKIIGNKYENPKLLEGK